MTATADPPVSLIVLECLVLAAFFGWAAYQALFQRMTGLFRLGLGLFRLFVVGIAYTSLWAGLTGENTDGGGARVVWIAVSVGIISGAILGFLQRRQIPKPTSQSPKAPFDVREYLGYVAVVTALHGVFAWVLSENPIPVEGLSLTPSWLDWPAQVVLKVLMPLTVSTFLTILPLKAMNKSLTSDWDLASGPDDTERTLRRKHYALAALPYLTCLSFSFDFAVLIYGLVFNLLILVLACFRTDLEPPVALVARLKALPAAIRGRRKRVCPDDDLSPDPALP